MGALERLLQSFVDLGGERAVLADERTAHLVAEGHTILSSRGIEGIDFDAQATSEGIRAKIRILEGVIVKKPIHLCFGVLHSRGNQNVTMDVRFEKNASAHFIAHCIFPDAERVVHTMNAEIVIEAGATMGYSETHFHGEHGGVEAIPRATVDVGRGGRYVGAFNLITGRVGRLDIDYSVTAEEYALAELTARVFGHADDKITIKEKVVLAGKYAKSLIKTRIALEHEAEAEVTGITEGNAAGARGHVDCMEIVRDNAVASAIPIVRVNNPLAKVTHEAAIGSVDKRQLETLMVHGLTPEEAVDVIVRGILK